MLIFDTATRVTFD